MTTTDNAKIQKAVITTESLQTNGKLDPVQADKFIDYVVDETGLGKTVRVVRFRNETMKIDKINVGRRVAVPKDEASDPGLRRGITTSKVELSPKEIMCPFEITDRFAEINLEGESAKTHIVQMMATTFANNLEELYINGNKLGPAILESDYREGGSDTHYIKDAYMGLVNGWSMLADSGNVLDMEGENISARTFAAASRQIPTKYRRKLKDMRCLVSPDLWSLYLERFSTRATAKGDDVIGGGSHDPFGMTAFPVPLWPIDPIQVEHVTLNGTTPVALKSSNITDVVVTISTLGANPVSPWVETTDYIIDYAAGTIARSPGSNIPDATVSKVTYHASAQMILCHRDNLILAIGRDITLEKDRDIYKGVDQYALSVKVDVQIQNLEAIVKVKNIGTGI